MARFCAGTSAPVVGLLPRSLRLAQFLPLSHFGLQVEIALRSMEGSCCAVSELLWNAGEFCAGHLTCVDSAVLEQGQHDHAAHDVRPVWTRSESHRERLAAGLLAEGRQLCSLEVGPCSCTEQTNGTRGFKRLVFHASSWNPFPSYSLVDML